MRHLIFSCCVLLTCASAANAQSAFGIGKGQPISALRDATPLPGSKNFWTVRAPQPHSEFESYVVVATGETGVCKIRGVGKDHDNDAYGVEVQSAFEDVKNALNEKYGTSKDFDYIKYDALWDESSEWVMAIRQNERTLASFWDRSEGSVMPEGLTSIGLEVGATSPNSSYITVDYEFDNFNDCVEIIEAKNEAGL